MALKDNDQRKWNGASHTKAKHTLLEKYLKAWIPILGSRNTLILYFDGFAGRGRYNDGSVGSPIIAMKACQEIIDSTRTTVKFNCFFIEQDPDNFANLEAEVEIAKKDYPSVNLARCINNDFDSTINRILDRGNSMAPAFFFIDPFGYSDIPMTTIKRILSQPRTEVFINLMSREINRFISLPNQERNFDALYGTADWREAKNYKGDAREVFLRDLYLASLSDNQSAEYVFPFKICEDSKCSTLYHLIYATNNFKGLEVMKGIMYNQSDVFAYLGPKERDSQFRQAQMTLFDDSQDALIGYLQELYPAGTMRTYDEIRHETYMNTPSIDKHYRSAIKELEKQGAVKIKRISSSQERKGVRESDQITFL